MRPITLSLPKGSGFDRQVVRVGRRSACACARRDKRQYRFLAAHQCKRDHQRLPASRPGNSPPLSPAPPHRSSPAPAARAPSRSACWWRALGWGLGGGGGQHDPADGLVALGDGDGAVGGVMGESRPKLSLSSWKSQEIAHDALLNFRILSSC